MRILYVEDNLTNVSLVRRVARMDHHEIIHYIDGESALQHWEEIQPDLVLMDLQLAGELNGLDVVRQLRAQGVDTPIVAVTAYAMLGDRDRCLAAGCDEYIAKPLAIHRLIELFRHYASEPPQVTRSAAVSGPASPFAALSLDSAAAAPPRIRIDLDKDPAPPAPAPVMTVSGQRQSVPAAPDVSPSVPPATDQSKPVQTDDEVRS